MIMKFSALAAILAAIGAAGAAQAECFGGREMTANAAIPAPAAPADGQQLAQSDVDSATTPLPPLGMTLAQATAAAESQMLASPSALDENEAAAE